MTCAATQRSRCCVSTVRRIAALTSRSLAQHFQNFGVYDILTGLMIKLPVAQTPREMDICFACESHDSLVRWDEQRQLVVDNAEFLGELRLARVRKVDTRRRFNGEQVRQARL